MPIPRALSQGLPIALFACAGIVFYRNCVIEGGGDFQIYWKIAGRVLAGGPTYDPASDIPMAFKYPPWCLPVFLPLAMLSFETAKAVWAAVSVASMFAVFAWVHFRLRCSLGSIAVALAVTWGVWAGQFNHGQVNVPVLAALLWCWHPELPRQSVWRSVGLLFAATTKIVSVYPLLYFRNPRRWAKSLAIAGALFVLLSLPSLLGTEPPRVVNLLRGWHAVAGSALQGFGAWFVRGRMNQGLPVLFGRAWDFMSLSDTPEVIGFFFFSAVIGLWWSRQSKRLKPEESWAGWVAWICLIQPLSWSHSFVLALPLLALCLDRAWKEGNRRALATVAFGLICVGLLTLNTAKAIGGLFGAPLALERASNLIEFLSIKSIGVLICALVFLRLAKGEQPHAPA